MDEFPRSTPHTEEEVEEEVGRQRQEKRDLGIVVSSGRVAIRNRINGGFV